MSDNKAFKPKGFTEIILTKYRGIIATIFLLPISALMTFGFWLKNKLVFLFQKADLKHEEKVQHIIQQIQDWGEEETTQKLCTSRSGWLTMSPFVPGYKKTHRNIEMDLNNIIKINEEKKTVLVEPFVNMGQITDLLNPLGWTLSVIPELDQLTVGGLIMGFGIESSSHKYGLFQYICHSFDVVTPDGKLLHCSKEENTELFYTLPWSHGTLGFLVAAELSIIPAKKYVRLEYKPLNSLEEIVTVFEEDSRAVEKNDFVETLMYSREKAVMMTGTLTDTIESGGKVNKIGYWFKPWFFTHVRKYLEKNQNGVEYIPLRDYYHRHTRSLFWEMGEVIPFGNNPLYRFLFGWATPPQMSLLKYLETDTTKKLREKYHVVQDMLVPISKLKKSLEYFDDNYDVYPLWICPMAVYGNEKNIGFIHPFTKKDGTKDEMYVDIGAYGSPKKPGFDGNPELEKLEKFVIENDGFQAMYAQTMLSKENFRKMFDHTSYDKLRKSIPNATRAFDDMYFKLTKGRISPVEYKKKKK